MRLITTSRLFQIALLLLGLGVSACGGGGGGGSPSVNPPGGAPPPGATPTPSPGSTQSPGGSPSPIGVTPTPNGTPTPFTPGPSPSPIQTTPPPAGQTILPDTTGRFSMIQVLDQWGRGNAQMTQAQIQQETHPPYDAVWGAFQPKYWQPGIILSRYYLPNEDASLISGHDLAYFQANHPDWILHGCDANGNPQPNYLAWSGTGFPNDTPLDIHNPAVVQYELQTIAQYAVANGYSTVAFDNIVFKNYLTSPNRELGESAPPGVSTTGWYGCGIYQTDGTFVRRYNPESSPDQSAWINDILNFLAQAQQYFASYHLHIIVNHPPFSHSPDVNEQKMLSYVDGMLDERGFVSYGNPQAAGTFNDTLAWMQYMQQTLHKAIFLANYWCVGSGCPTDPSQMSPTQVDFGLATYALGNYGGAGVYISQASGATYTYRSEYLARYGSACGDYSKFGTAYVRRFKGGFAVANPSDGSTQVVPWPTGHTYKDVTNRAVSNPLSVAPGDAFMLQLTSGGDGCM